MWMVCPPSARLGESLADQGSTYTEEGTLAHRIGELLLRKRWEGADITAELEQAQADPLYSGAMGEHMESYAAFIEERMAEARTRCEDPRIFIEQTVRFEEYVPGGFGTSDAIILSDGVMDVIDLKYGKGVPVSAEGNPQMRIYGLGCYLALSWAYRIDTIRMTIFQPRLDSISTASMTTDELLTWAETELKPKAALAWEGKGDFCPGEAQCRWCKAAAVCRAHRDYQMEIARRDFADPPLLSPEEIADVLKRLPALQAWAKKVEEYALDAAVKGEAEFPGFKVVEGRSNRRYTRAVTRKTFTAAAARIFEPGCKFDYVLTLSGPQGRGKSTLVAKMSNGWYTDSLAGIGTKEAYENIQGYWLVELGELAAMRKIEIETIKNFISKQVDS